MSFTRGFRGRGHTERNPGLPPGQYDVGSDWPVLTAEATPQLATSSWTFAVEGLVRRPVTWSWEEIHALPAASYDGGHPLRDDVVQVRRALLWGFSRHPPRRG